MAVLRRNGSREILDFLDSQIKARKDYTGARGQASNPKNSGWTETKGMQGEPGGPGRETYMLSYCGIHVKVPLDKSTFDLIDDATELNGDDLQLIKMVNEQDWKTIREAWADQWQKNRAYAAFEEGFPSGEYL